MRIASMLLLVALAGTPFVTGAAAPSAAPVRSSAPTALPTFDPRQPFFRLERYSGRSRADRGYSIRIYPDARFDYTSGAEAPFKGLLPKAHVEKLKLEVLTTDFKALAAADFPPCPPVYDAAAFAYFFETPQGTVMLKPCHDAPASRSPLMATERQLERDVADSMKRAHPKQG